MVSITPLYFFIFLNDDIQNLEDSIGTDIDNKLDIIIDTINTKIPSLSNNKLSGSITAQAGPGYGTIVIETPNGLQIKEIKCTNTSNATPGTPGNQLIIIKVGGTTVDSFIVISTGTHISDLSEVLDKTLEISINVNCVNNVTTTCYYNIEYEPIAI